MPRAKIPLSQHQSALRVFHDSVSFVTTIPFRSHTCASIAHYLMWRTFALYLVSFAGVLSLVACNDPARPGNRKGTPISTTLLCHCEPIDITKDDWRIEYKNESLPAREPEDTTVAAILGWPEGPEPDPRTPRSGPELKMYRIRHAYMQTIFLRKGDCDLHVEISEQPDKNAPRMIVETPGTSTYCAARTKMYVDLQHRGFTLTDLNQELSPPLSVEVEGAAFRDQAHTVWSARGSDRVKTLWEIHPAIVRINF